MRTVNVKRGSVLPIGRLGENEATVVVFDIANWRNLYGDGTFYLLNQRNGDIAPYPCVIEQDDTQVRWTVQSADVARVGRGQCELIYTVDDTIAKSEIYTTVVGKALTGGAEPPEPWEDWVQRVIEAGTQAQASAASALADANRAESSAEDAENAKTAAETAKAGAQNAQTAAESARDTAQTAAQPASASATAAGTAQTAAEAAQGAAETAEGNAEQYASTATTKAAEAATSEQNAFNYQQGAKEYRDETEAMLDDLVKYDNDEFSSPLPLNADQLNGHPDTYFAKQDDMSAAEADIARKYEKPLTGIPKADLDSGVQASLDKADSALQEHQSLSAYRTAEQQDEIDAQKYSASNPPPYPVTSVNGRTGGVVLNYITYDEEEE